jgi:hypothetical protein
MAVAKANGNTPGLLCWLRVQLCFEPCFGSDFGRLEQYLSVAYRGALRSVCGVSVTVAARFYGLSGVRLLPKSAFFLSIDL